MDRKHTSHDTEMSDTELESVAGGSFVRRVLDIFCRNTDIAVADEAQGMFHGVDPSKGDIRWEERGVAL